MTVCPEQDSNLHTSRHTHLKRARLPIPPPGLSTSGKRDSKPFLTLSSFGSLLSGKRDSNSRPRPWQGRALPTELLPHFLQSGAKVVVLGILAKTIATFFNLSGTFYLFSRESMCFWAVAQTSCGFIERHLRFSTTMLPFTMTVSTSDACVLYTSSETRFV